MKCCVECFNDIEIKSRIKQLKKVGNCNLCEAVNVFIYDTEVDFELVDDFEALLDTYRPENILPDDFPDEELRFLTDELAVNWDIFNLTANKIDILIKNRLYTEISA